MKALEDLALKYDMTVRTSNSDVVQFSFGDVGCLRHSNMGE